MHCASIVLALLAALRAGGYEFSRFASTSNDSNASTIIVLFTQSISYRVAIATITSKLLKSIILLKCEEYFFTSDNQFGFKAGHSTEFCIYSLLEFIDFYKKNTTVFVTFLDASKAFD